MTRLLVRTIKTLCSILGAMLRHFSFGQLETVLLADP